MKVCQKYSFDHWRIQAIQAIDQVDNDIKKYLRALEGGYKPAGMVLPNQETINDIRSMLIQPEYHSSREMIRSTLDFPMSVRFFSQSPDFPLIPGDATDTPVVQISKNYACLRHSTPPNSS